MSDLQRYNGIDTIATFRLWEEFEKQLSQKPWASETYTLVKQLQAPAFYAGLRGILVDPEVVQDLKPTFEAECARVEEVLDSITKPLLNRVINLGSPQQLKWLFNCFGANPRKTDREHLEKLQKTDPELAPIITLVLL